MSEYSYKYNPNRGSDWNYGGKKWKLSRSKIDLFTECRRCFYLDNKLGTKRPSFPSFNLNIAVDELCKKEFDTHRKAGTAHPLMLQYGIDAVPFKHKDIDLWQENFTGIMATHEETGLLVSGAIDDVWVTPEDTLIVVDYKSTSKEARIEKLGDSPWEQQYTRQLGVYRWLLEMNSFATEETGYLVYANANKELDEFANQLIFDTTIVPVQTTITWLDETLVAIKNTLESDELPPTGEHCEYCPYREAAGKKLQAIHFSKQKKHEK